MPEQLGLFGAPEPAVKKAPKRPRPPTAMESEDECSARTVREELGELAACEHHGPTYVCELCPQGYPTDGLGFVAIKHSTALGLLPLRCCMGCRQMVTPGRWNHADWWHCLECQPHGTISEHSRPVWEALQKTTAQKKLR